MERSGIELDTEQPTAVVDDATPGGFPLMAPSEDAAATLRDQTRQHWRLAATLFVGGGLGAILPDALHEPPHPATIYLLPLLALVSGAVCWALSTRLSRSWLNLVIVIATLEIALTVWLADPVFASYYAFIAIFTAYVLNDRRLITAQIAFASLVAFAPTLYSPETARESLIQALVLIPTLILAGGAVTFLRERLAASEDRYRCLSERDPLTGVGNYRMLTNRVPRELDSHRRHGRSLAMLVIDLDDFKWVNDRHGHQRGDGVLQEVGRTLAECVRAHDILVRQGGDEFAVVAPEANRDAADELAGRVTRVVSAIAVDGHAIGVSVGSAMFPDDGDTLEALLGRADARLREIKEAKSLRRPRPGEFPPKRDRLN